MIKTFKHKGIEKFFYTGDHARISKKNVKKLRMVLAMLNTANSIEDMSAPSLRLHKLKGNRKDVYSLSVSGNWRITFSLEAGDVYDVNYEDYH